ncbi:MAG: heme-binding domain-containing protein [Ferruginibacter sp.]
MKKILKSIGYVLLVGLIIIQFFRPTKNIDISGNLKDNDISKAYYVPKDVTTILETSCYDCHSNNTAYPWYSKLQPVAWWLQDHIDEGKKEINFSEFATYRIGRKYKKLV